MITIRRSDERGRGEHGWLSTRHTFSFAQYHDPAWMGWGALRVINEDRVAPGAGFPMHPHADMEILTWVLEGALEHRDTAGHQGVIRPGQVQRMSAGTGIRHSETNASAAVPVHLLQIWILPDRRGHEPGYEERALDDLDRRDRLGLLASPDGAQGSVRLHQDATVHVASLAPQVRAVHAFAPGRQGWLHVARGRLALDGTVLEAGDGAGLRGETSLAITALDEAELLLFDVP
jgi:hypothetical protein